MAPRRKEADDGSDSEPESGGGGGLRGGSEAPKLTDQMILLSSLVAEADLFTRHADYAAAIALYSRALELKPSSTHLLICRSRCRALQGDTAGALADAEAILALEPKSSRGILCKADALFAAGDFEMAMVWYHRGDRIRGEQVEFRRGVVRCREAIERAMTEVDAEKMRAARQAAKLRAAAAAAGSGTVVVDGDSKANLIMMMDPHMLQGGTAAAAGSSAGAAAGPALVPGSDRPSGVLPPPIAPARMRRQMAEQRRSKPGAQRGAQALVPGSTHSASSPSPQPGMQKSRKSPQEMPSRVQGIRDAKHAPQPAAGLASPRRMASQQRLAEMDHNLLEELYDDYTFLKDLESDAVFMAAGQGQVSVYVNEALKYLDGRIEFWRARNPRGLHETTVVDAIPHTMPQANVQQLQPNAKGAATVLGPSLGTTADLVLVGIPTKNSIPLRQPKNASDLLC
ncbi:Tetratricopeptide repeat protein 25 [Polyrhizophydium stewartii]|uniref:Outer dynein arm-docking complex subunit 4 n=1 Tax=Polyrhizophydium stewartii TaxID=2732419 RepID=A0ABR4MYK0_9FUNG